MPAGLQPGWHMVLSESCDKDTGGLMSSEGHPDMVPELLIEMGLLRIES